jgi:hypothetical protein
MLRSKRQTMDGQPTWPWLRSEGQVPFGVLRVAQSAGEWQPSRAGPFASSLLKSGARQKLAFLRLNN